MAVTELHAVQKYESALVFERPPYLPGSTSNATLLRAVKCAALGVKDEHIAQMLGVPVGALDYWTKTKEWKALRNQIEPEIREIVKNTVADMAAKAIRELNDRLDRGNLRSRMETQAEAGEGVKPKRIEYRVPLDASDLASIATTLFDRSDRLDRTIKGLDSPEMEEVKALAAKLHRLDEKEIQGEAVVIAEPELPPHVAVVPDDELPATTPPPIGSQ
jgi:hypothetical protein